MTSWALRPSSGGGFVPPSRGYGRSRGAGDTGDRSRARRPRTATAIASAAIRGAGPRLKRPPPPPSDIPSCADIDTLEEALIVSIRTAGLKPGRENQLAEEATRLRRRRKRWLEDTGQVVREWNAHASLLWDLHQQELSKLAAERREETRRHERSVALLTKQLTDERERVSKATTKESMAAAAQLRAVQEAHDSWKKAHREEVLAEAQQEVSRATARLSRDAERHARSLRDRLQAEFNDRLHSVVEESEEAAAKAHAADTKVLQLESIKRRLEAQVTEAAERIRRIERLSKTQQNVVDDEKSDLRKRAERLDRRLEEEQTLRERNTSAYAAEIRALRSQWEEELLVVDARVRSVIGAKDQALQQLMDDLSNATRRAQTAEALLEELQFRICPATSSPTR